MAVTDLLYIIIIIFVIAFSIFLASYLSTTVLENIKGQVGASASSILTGVQGIFGMFDSLFIVIVMFLGIGIIILAFLLPSHPIFLFLAVIMLLITLVIAPVFSNAIKAIAGTSPISTVSGNYPLMSLMFKNLPVYILIIGVIMLVVMYGKMQSERDGR